MVGDEPVREGRETRSTGPRPEDTRGNCVVRQKGCRNCPTNDTNFVSGRVGGRGNGFICVSTEDQETRGRT